jgi:hypothetical protein
VVDGDEITLHFATFNPEDFRELTAQYVSGSRKVNICATTIVLNLCANVLEHISSDLREII